MRRYIFSLAFLLLAVFLLLTCVSCLERTEEITIGEDGTARIVTELSGSKDIFGKIMAYPAEPEWTIIEKDTATNDDKTKIKAEMTIPYGQPWPHSFARDDNPMADAHLQFPAEIKFWTEGNRTYYEFKRTYKMRPFRSKNLSKNPLWDQDLENRVLEKGIFEATEQDREAYLDQFAMAYGYLHWHFLWETLGTMVRQGDITLVEKQKIENQAAHHAEEVVTPVRILGILGKDDKSMDEALDNLKNELHDSFGRIFESNVSGDASKLWQKYNSIFQKIALEYEITEVLGGHRFFIGINMPGTIIEANGLLELDEPGKVEWCFVGEDFYDTDFVLHALSVVEK